MVPSCPRSAAAGCCAERKDCRSWTSGTIAGHEQLEFRDVHAFDARTAVLMSAGEGSDSRLVRTTNVAESWTETFAVTEPDAGLDTGRIKTTARRDGDGYVIEGRKIWTSTAQRADRVVLLARTAEPAADRMKMPRARAIK